MTTIKEAILRKDGIIRTRLSVNRPNKTYFLDLMTFNAEGYYNASKSFTIAEYGSLDCAIGYFTEIVNHNKMSVLS